VSSERGGGEWGGGRAGSFWPNLTGGKRRVGMFFLRESDVQKGEVKRESRKRIGSEENKGCTYETD